MSLETTAVSPSTPSPSAELSAFVAATAFPDLPAEVLAAVRAAVADVLVCIATGSGASVAAAACQVVARDGAAGDASVIGRDVRLPAPYAALVNAAAAHQVGVAGIRVVVVSAALALSERERASGLQFVLAVALGLEVAQRVAAALSSSHLARGYELAGTAGRVGAAAAAASVLGLGAETVLSSFGYAATTTGGLAASPTDTRALVAGLAAADGVWAALLAAAGLVGPPLPLEGRRGLLALESVTAKPERLVEGLRSSWLLSASLGPTHITTPSVLDSFVANLDDIASLDALVLATEELARTT